MLGQMMLAIFGLGVEGEMEKWRNGEMESFNG